MQRRLTLRRRRFARKRLGSPADQPPATGGEASDVSPRTGVAPDPNSGPLLHVSRLLSAFPPRQKDTCESKSAVQLPDRIRPAASLHPTTTPAGTRSRGGQARCRVKLRRQLFLQNGRLTILEPFKENRARKNTKHVFPLPWTARAPRRCSGPTMPTSSS